MSKLKTKRKKHYLAAAMLAMLAVATPITFYGSVTTYAQTDDAAGAESGEDTGEVTNEETGYHYQKTGEPLVEEKDNNGNIWRIYAAAENTADTEATADTAAAVDTEDTSVKKYIATITYGGVDTNSSRAGEFSVFSGYADVFAKYNIVQVEVGEGLTYFNVYSPPENLQYEYIYLPSTMQKLTTALVQQQKKLKEITIPASVTEFNSGSFNHGMFYMDESLEKITFEEGCKLTSFGKNVQNLLYGCKSLKEFTVPASIETIPERCFYNSQYLETIRFEKGSKVESIGKEAFYACCALKDVELAEGLTTIGESAFRNLDQIEKLVIPGTVTTIGICAFYDCDGLQEIAIPDSVTSIGKAAFAYCRNVTDIKLPNRLETIEEQAFMGCSMVTSLRIPDSVKTIKNEAFRYIYITELPYMQNVTTIGTRAFSISSNLRSLEYPKCLTDFTATSLDGGGNAKIKYITFEDGCALNTLPEGLFSTYKENNTNLKEQREIKLPLSLKELNMNVFCGSWNRTIVEIPHTDKDSLQLTLTDYGTTSKETIGKSLKMMYYTVHSFEVYRCLTETFGVPRDHITFHEEKVGWKLTGVKDGIYTYTAECSTCGEVSKSLTYDENGFATVDGSYQPAEQVTAENCKAFGLDENYIGYYAVSNAGQLYWFADYVNGNGDDATPHLSESVVLCEDIEMNDTSKLDSWTIDTTDVINWPAIGAFNVNFDNYNIVYQGTFDGNHKTIRGLYRRNRGENNEAGLIGYIGKSGALKDLTIEKSFVMGSSVFVGLNNGSVTNCTAGAMRTRYCGHGGAIFVYRNYGVMDACVNTADVEWIDKQRENCFGIVDMNYGIVKNCVNRGAINNTGGRISGDVGGICDWNNGKILNCSNEASITSTGHASGIVRNNRGYVANCVNTGALTGTYVGGIAAGTGAAEGGDVIIVNPSIGGWDDTTGGSSSDSGSGSTGEEEKLIPVSLSQYGIYYCYNTGSVTASNSCAGGIAADAIGSKGTIYGCYNTGDVEGGSHTGGIVGSAENVLIRDCYNYSTDIRTTDVATSFQNNEPHAFAAPIAGCVSSYLGNAVVSNCYYVGDSDAEAYGYSMNLQGHKVTFTDNEAMTVEEFESGKVAWKLQNAVNEDLKAAGGKQLFVWKQIITGAAFSKYPNLKLTEKETDRTVMQMTFHYTTGGKDLAGYGYTNYNHAVTEDQAPTVAGKNDAVHTFDWYEDKELTTLYDFAHVLTTDEDVYSKTYDLYTLEFKLAEGSHAAASIDKKKVTEIITETDETVVFTVTPDAGYILESVTLDGETLEPDEDGNYTISGIKTNHIVEITTKETEVTFTYKAGEHGTVKWVGDKTGSGELTETIKAVSGTPKGVLPEADLGWHFVKWVDSKDNVPTYSINGLYPAAVNGVFESETYTAIFEKNVETYTISGTVHDPEGNPVPGVTVYLRENGNTKKTKSAEDGSYQFEKLEEAEYNLSAIKSYENAWKAESETRVVRLEAADATDQDLELSMQRENIGHDVIIDYYRVTLTERAQDYLNESGDNVIEGSDYSLSAKDKYSNAHAAVYVYEAAMGFDGNYYKLSDEVAEALKTDGRCYTIKNIGKDYIIDVKAEDVIPNRYEVTIPSGGDDYTILPEKEGETISYGEDYSFTVKAAAGRCVLVSANGTRIEFADGKYTIKNVTKPQKIVVEFADQHTCGEWKVVTPATYDAAGEETRTCSVCGAVEIRELAQLICDHEAKRLITDKEATCTMAGSGHYVCDTCGKTVQENVSIAAKGHIWTAWTVTVKPTTSKAGEESRTCSVCKQTEKHQVSKLSQKKYKITYKLNKGKNNKKNPKTYTSAKKVVLKKPTRKGYAFKGWYTDRKCTKKITSIKKGSKKNYTIYAKWSKVKVKKTTGLKVMNTKGKNLVVRYSKVSGAKGYQITYATNSKFTKGKKVVNTTKRTKTIQKLKKGKTYYVRVRAYKKDSTGRKVYGKYSTVKKIKITK